MSQLGACLNYDDVDDDVDDEKKRALCKRLSEKEIEEF